MMGPSSKLDDYIIVKKSAIPAVICDDVICKIENDQWRKHTWYNKVQMLLTLKTLKSCLF